MDGWTSKQTLTVEIDGWMNLWNWWMNEQANGGIEKTGGRMN